jgi:hypothetical protein
MPANRGIGSRTLFSTFQGIHSGCCTVAAHWRPYASSKAWKLISGAGKKTMYALQCKDRAGNVSATASDAITYRP